MSYDPNTPGAGDKISQTQAPIQTNFATINTSFSVNHEALGTASQGKHKFMQMPEQSSAPATAGNEGALYTKETLATITGLYFRREGSGTELQLTDIDFSSSTVVGGTQRTFVHPLGFRVTFGLTGTISNGATVTYTTPFFSSPYFVQLTVNDPNNHYASHRTNASTGFVVDLSAGSVAGLSYFVIGPVS